MGDPEAPQGQRFSFVYGHRGEPQADSVRMRRRIGEQVYRFRILEESLGTKIRQEIGIEARFPVHWPEFFERLRLQDFLDAITIALRVLAEHQYGGEDARQWLRAIQRIFTEENVHYRIDGSGGVHYLVDAQFYHARAAAVAALQAPRYANVLDSFERGMAALSEAMPDGKQGIRGVFAAVESLFRLMTNAARLGTAELDQLNPILQRLFADDATARRSANKMLNSLKDWTDAAHFYRHEEGAEEVAQPPISLAVYLCDAGASHLRWLAELDQAMIQE